MAANGASRVLAVPLALILGLGLLLACAKEKKTEGPVKPAVSKDWRVLLGPDPCDLKDPGGNRITIQRVKRNEHKIAWESFDGRLNIYFIAHVPPCGVPPSSTWKKIGTDPEGRDLYLIGDGTKPKVDSGRFEANACPSDDNNPKTWIKYDQYIQVPDTGVFRSCDGMIIIDP